MKTIKEKAPTSLSEELERNFDSCWTPSFELGEDPYFSTESAINKSGAVVKEIAKDYNEWFSKRLASWMDSQIDFPEMEDEEIDLFDVYLKERYEQR